METKQELLKEVRDRELFNPIPFIQQKLSQEQLSFQKELELIGNHEISVSPDLFENVFYTLSEKQEKQDKSHQSGQPYQGENANE